MCACNLGYQAVLAGHTALFIAAGELLGELAATDSDAALRRKLRHYVAPELRVIDEVGYLSYSNRHADLLFELVSRRYQVKSTIVTTNNAFADWNEVFPSAACVVWLVDRLMHRTEVVRIEGESYRAREARERETLRNAERAAKAPAHWTPEQALAVLECLHTMRQALWQAYGAQVQQAWREQIVTDGPPPEFNPELPF